MERNSLPLCYPAGERWLGKDVASSFNEVDFYNEAAALGVLPWPGVLIRALGS